MGELRTHRHYPGLDGLRGCAVLAVLVAHTHPVGWRLLRTGAGGVDLFFTLSGFLITSILLTDLRVCGRVRFRNFFARRVLRLLPCLLVVVAATSAYLVAAGRWDDQRRLEVITALTYTTNYAGELGLQYGDGARYLRHTWSLAIEEQYYLLWPVMLASLVATGWSHRRLALVIGLGGVVVAVYRASMAYSVPLVRLYHGLDTHCDGLLFGSALALLVADRGAAPLPPLLARATTRALVPGAVVGLLAVSHFGHWGHKAYQIVGHSANAVGAVVLIADVTLNPRSWLRPVLENKILMWFGTISYGLYLWHLPIQEAVADHEWIGRRFGRFGTALLIDAASVGAAAASFYLVERPVLGLKKFFPSGGDGQSGAPGAGTESTRSKQA